MCCAHLQGGQETLRDRQNNAGQVTAIEQSKTRGEREDQRKEPHWPGQKAPVCNGEAGVEWAWDCFWEQNLDDQSSSCSLFGEVSS